METTSIIAYQKALNSGIIHKLKLDVFKTICQNRNCTQREISIIFRKQFPNISDSSIHARFGELEKNGLIYKKGRRMCNVHEDELVNYYDITGNDPVKINKKKKNADDKELIQNAKNDAFEEVLFFLQGLITDEKTSIGKNCLRLAFQGVSKFQNFKK